MNNLKFVFYNKRISVVKNVMFLSGTAHSSGYVEQRSEIKVWVACSDSIALNVWNKSFVRALRENVCIP